MTLVRMIYRLILNQDCDQMELNSHIMLLGHVLIPHVDHFNAVGLAIHP